MFIEFASREISKTNLDGSMHSHTRHGKLETDYFDIDTVDNMLYYFDRDDGYIKRAPVDDTTTETLTTLDGLRVWNIAVDWIGRYFLSNFYQQLTYSRHGTINHTR